MDEIKPVIGWCPVCNAFRVEIGCGCADCGNHLMTTERALEQARIAGMREATKQFTDRADREYCLGVDYSKRDECLGEEFKLSTGAFRAINLDAHRQVARRMGAHFVIHEIASAINRAIEDKEHD